MNYQQTIEFLYSSLPIFQSQGAGAYKPGLDSTLNFLEKLGNPHKDLKTIHVAGTNGKGSCSHALASVYQEAGFKVGLYTSPHLFDFRERIKINGEMISQDEVVNFIAKNKENIKGLSFFEMCVGMAFSYFAAEKTDIAIIEVGLGGRLDSTNVISPELSIITNIGLDHTNLLGDNLAQIAGEKAGVIKPNTPIIIGERNPETLQVFLNKAKEQNAPITFAQDLALEAECDLKGIYQKQNIATVLAALKALDFNNKKAIENGLKNIVKNTGLRGRWETLQEKPLTICDTGHNAHGLSQVVKQIKEQKYKDLYIIIGVVGDKDADAALSLMPQKAHYIFTQANIERAMPAEELAKKAEQYSLKGEVIKSVSEAYAKAQSLASQDDMIFIGGSTFIVADLNLE